MAGLREKQLQKRKQETLDVALKLLVERGYANLNMDELAEEVGISKPTLYQDFNSKDELVAQVMVRMFEKMAGEIAVHADKSPLAQLEHFLRHMAKSRAEKRHIMAQMDSEIRRSILQRYPYLREQLLESRSKLGQIVLKAQEQGDIDPSLPAWVVVNTLFALAASISNPLVLEESHRSSEEIAEAIESIVQIFKRGVGTSVGQSAVQSVDAVGAVPHGR